VVQIEPNAYAALRRHGEEAYPEESCGILLGRFLGEDRRAIAAIPCVNASRDSPHNRYAIDPKDLIRIHREAREQSLDIVGFYHSHPDHPAHWSSTDLADAHWLGYSYVITRVEGGQAVETRSFQLAGSEEEKRFEEEAILQQNAEENVGKPHPLS
jgi:proteasome lid subunit RPN8/RPN11